MSSARPLVRRRLAWALAVPLIATSLEVAHAASYQLVYPDGPGRARVLALSGHGYERHFPAVAALLASVLVGALLARIFTPRRPGLMSIDARVFFALPPTAFVLQEALELVSAGQAPYDVALSPVLLPGLVMQLPFAALAWFVGHLLVDAADVVAHAIRCIPRVALHVFVTRLTSNRHELPPRRPPTSDAHPRGPPTRVSSRSGVPHPRRRPFDLTISGGFTMHRPLALVVVFAVLSLASVSAASPAAAAFPDAPRLFVLDPAWLAAERPSLKRLVFLCECLADVPGIEMLLGDPHAIVPAHAAALGCDGVAISETPCPRTRRTVAAIAATQRGATVLWPPFCDRSRVRDLGRFSRYWQQVSTSALRPTAS